MSKQTGCPRDRSMWHLQPLMRREAATAEEAMTLVFDRRRAACRRTSRRYHSQHRWRELPVLLLPLLAPEVETLKRRSILVQSLPLHCSCPQPQCLSCLPPFCHGGSCRRCCQSKFSPCLLSSGGLPCLQSCETSRAVVVVFVFSFHPRPCLPPLRRLQSRSLPST